MGMTITRWEKTMIPQTFEGISFANDYEKRLKEQGAFRSRKEDTQFIIIEAEYHFTIKGVIDGNKD